MLDRLAPAPETADQQPKCARPWRLLLVGCFALAALSLTLPSVPTYDPWAWIIWGREVAHLDLVTTDGPSWKPLPVLFTTVFSLFGSGAPGLLVVPRAPPRSPRSCSRSGGRAASAAAGSAASRRRPRWRSPRGGSAARRSATPR